MSIFKMTTCCADKEKGNQKMMRTPHVNMDMLAKQWPFPLYNQNLSFLQPRVVVQVSKASWTHNNKSNYVFYSRD